MKTKLCATIVLFTILFSCQKNDSKRVEGYDSIIGTWINPESNDSNLVMDKCLTLKEDAYGCVFKSDGSFIERKNAGGCGTPPISYSNFEGTWTRKDSMLLISVAYWGGIATYEWKILSLSGDILTIKRISENYHQQEEK